MTKVPPFLKKYFWDADYKQLDLEKNKKYIIERLLELGNKKAIQWLLNNFKKSDIAQTLKTTRNLSRLSANFWSNLYGIPKKEVRCLTTQFQKTHRKIWNY